MVRWSGEVPLGWDQCIFGDFKKKLYKTIRTAMLYSIEFLANKRVQGIKLGTEELIILWRMSGKTRKDRLRNE